MTLVRLEPAASRFRVKHSTTEPLGSPKLNELSSMFTFSYTDEQKLETVHVHFTNNIEIVQEIGVSGVYLHFCTKFLDKHKI